MAVPTIRNTGTVTAQTTSPLAPANPTHQTGDLLIALVGSTSIAGSAPTIAAPTGGAWTLIGEQTGTVDQGGTTYGATAVYAIRATSNAMSNPSMVMTGTGTSYAHTARVIAITAGTWNDTGTLTDAWEDVTYAINSATSGDVAVNATGLATTGLFRLCIAHCFCADNSPSGLTNDASYSTAGTDSDSSTGADTYLGTRYLSSPNSGGGGATFTFTAAGVATTRPPCMVVAFGLKPSVSGAVTDSTTVSDVYAVAVDAPAQPITGSETDSTTATDANDEGFGIGKDQTDSTPASDVCVGAVGTPAASLAIEAGFPVVQKGGAAAATRTVTITTAGASLIVAVINGKGSNSNTFPLTSVAGAGLTWTKSTASSSASIDFGSAGVEIWTAPSSGGISAQVITATTPQNFNSSAMFSVYSITGAAASPIGAAHVTAYNAAGATLADTITATASGSFIIVGAHNISSSTGLTADADNSPWDDSYSDLGNGQSFGVGHATTTASGDITVGATNSLAKWYCGTIEILAGTGGAQPSGSETDSSAATDPQSGITGIPGRDQTDTTTATDADASKIGIPGQSETDTATPSDADTGAYGIRYAQTDTATVSDVVASLIGLPSYAQTDSTAIADGWAVQYAEEAGEVTGEETDRAAASDLDAPRYGIAYAQTDTSAITDADAPRYGVAYAETDSTTATDADASLVGIPGYSETDAAPLVDAWSGTVAASGQYFQTDSTAITDVDASLVGIAGRAETDTTTATDADASQIGIPARAQTDSTAASDTDASLLGIAGRSETDSTPLTDAQIAILGIAGRAQTDSTTATDVWAGIVASAGQYLETDTVALSDSDALGTYIAKATVEATALADSYVCAIASGTVTVTQADTVIPSDLWAASVVSDTVTGTETDTVIASDRMALGKAGYPKGLYVWNGSGWV